MIRLALVVFVVCAVVYSDPSSACAAPSYTVIDRHGAGSATPRYWVLIGEYPSGTVLHDSQGKALGTSLTGHAFVIFGRENDSTQSTEVRGVGFYPSAENGKTYVESVLGLSVPGSLRNVFSYNDFDWSRDTEKFLSIQVNSDQFNAAAAVYTEYFAQPPPYNLWTNNCTHFAIGVAESIGALPQFFSVDTVTPAQLVAHIADSVQKTWHLQYDDGTVIDTTLWPVDSLHGKWYDDNAKLTLPSGTVVQGAFANGAVLPGAKMSVTFPDGDRYDGTLVESSGLKHGTYTSKNYQQTGTYDDSWHLTEGNVRGSNYQLIGTFSAGQLVRGNAYLPGVHITLNGPGKDRIDYSDGNSFVGTLVNYEPSGHGNFIYKDGGIVICEWKAGTCPKGSYHKDGNQRSISVDGAGNVRSLPDDAAPINYPPNVSSIPPDACGGVRGTVTVGSQPPDTSESELRTTHSSNTTLKSRMLSLRVNERGLKVKKAYVITRKKAQVKSTKKKLR